MSYNHQEDKKMGKRLFAVLFSGLMLTTTACAGTVDFVVPPCNSEAVIESATSLAQTKDVVNPRTVRLYHIRQVIYHPGVSRACVATIQDKHHRDMDFFYQVTITHGVNWIVSGVDL